LGWRRPEPGQTTGDGVQVLSRIRHISLCFYVNAYHRLPSNSSERRASILNSA
jgi:hypothetical protein